MERPELEGDIQMIDKKYTKPKWAVRQIKRDGMIEDICKHGIGHPNEVWLKEMIDLHGEEDGGCMGVHGCDCCCFDKTKKD